MEAYLSKKVFGNCDFQEAHLLVACLWAQHF